MTTKDFIEDLESAFGRNNPFLIEEILKVEKNCAPYTIQHKISEAVKSGAIMRCRAGVYYLPKQTEFGIAEPSVDKVLLKKYISNGEDVFGIYGKWMLKQSFGLITHVSKMIEIITNNTVMESRRMEIEGRKIILHRPRLPITKNNVSAYTLLELFTIMDVKEYVTNVRKRVVEFINEKNITKDDLMSIAYAFPQKTMHKMAISGVFDNIR